MRSGFVVGGADGQVLIFRLWEAEQAPRPAKVGDYLQVATAQGPAAQGAVRDLDHYGTQMLAWCNELCALPLHDILSETEAAATLHTGDVDEAPKTWPFGVAVSGAHSGAVTAMASAVSKPLLVSCGEDRTVRVWDYRSWTCQLVSVQNEQPQCMALHPDGMQLLLSFRERLRAYHIGISDLIP